MKNQIFIVMYSFQNEEENGTFILGAYDTKEKALNKIKTTKEDIIHNNTFDGEYKYESEVDTTADYCGYCESYSSDFERVYLVVKEIE